MLFVFVYVIVMFKIKERGKGEEGGGQSALVIWGRALVAGETRTLIVIVSGYCEGNVGT